MEVPVVFNVPKDNTMKVVIPIAILIVSFLFGTQIKRATKIIVHTDTTGKFESLQTALHERGYSIDRKNDALKVIVSKEKSGVIICARVSDSSIVFTGQVVNNITLPLYGIRQEKSIDSINSGAGWAELFSFAELFGKITIK